MLCVMMSVRNSLSIAETGLGFSSQDECFGENLSTAGDVDICRVRILHVYPHFLKNDWASMKNPLCL